MNDKFESRLLADLVAAQQTIGPGVSPVPQRTRTRALRLGLVAVVVAGAVAAVLGLVVFNGGQPKASAAEIKSRALAALTDANDLIMHSNQTSMSQSYNSSGPTTTQTLHEELWQDLTAHKTRVVSYDPDGSPRSQIVITHDGTSVTFNQVLYFAHLWITATGTEAIAFPAGGSAQYAQNIEDQIASGAFTFVGSDTVGGRDTLHLRRILPQPPLPPNAPPGYKPVFATQLDMWIDPASYLPVREVLTTSGGNVVGTTDFDWLPRTAANLANLDIVVPPGFKHETEQAQQGSSCSTQVTNGGTTRSCSFSFGSISHP